MADLLLNGQNVRPTRLLDAGFQFRYPTLQEALQHIFED
jgi:NAD dependent epimerase/dehydratase family enzyme